MLRRKNQCKIWRLENEKLLPECLQETNTGDSGKIAIWSGISGHGTSILRLYSENMNGALYCDVLQIELKKSIQKLPQRNQIVYSKTWPPWHTSKIVKEKAEEMSLKVLQWTSKSPDLNPFVILLSIGENSLKLFFPPLDVQLYAIKKNLII